MSGRDSGPGPHTTVRRQEVTTRQLMKKGAVTMSVDLHSAVRATLAGTSTHGDIERLDDSGLDHPILCSLTVASLLRTVSLVATLAGTLPPQVAFAQSAQACDAFSRDRAGNIL